MGKLRSFFLAEMLGLFGERFGRSTEAGLDEMLGFFEKKWACVQLRPAWLECQAALVRRRLKRGALVGEGRVCVFVSRRTSKPAFVCLSFPSNVNRKQSSTKRGDVFTDYDELSGDFEAWCWREALHELGLPSPTVCVLHGRRLFLRVI